MANGHQRLSKKQGMTLGIRHRCFPPYNSNIKLSQMSYINLSLEQTFKPGAYVGLPFLLNKPPKKPS